MKQCLVVGVMVLAFLAFAMPASADEGVFQKTADWIATWSNPCVASAAKPVAATAKVVTAVCEATTDVLGNVVPTATVKEGKRPVWIKK